MNRIQAKVTSAQVVNRIKIEYGTAQSKHTMAKTKSSSPAGVDTKLLHLLRKLVNPSGSEESVEHLINRLKLQHREYQRKDPSWLQRNVEKALAVIQDGTTGSSQNKRSLDDIEEERYDHEARDSDAIRMALNDESVGMSLNASLRDKYKLQREKEAAEEKIKQDDALSKIANKRIKRRKTLQDAQVPSLASFLTPVARPTERYQDLGGLNDILQQIRQVIEYPLIRPELYYHLGVDPPRGVLLRGPPGCGKSHLANAIAGQMGLPFFRVSAPELVSGMSGESEGRIRDLFQAASDLAPSLIFLDELDAIAPKRSEGGSSRGMEKRMVAQLLTSMDMVAPKYNRNQAAVIILGATNRPDAMDPALRRAGRFDKEILLGVPDEAARFAILKTMTKGMRLCGDFDFKKLARLTPGYVGADVRSLTKEAAVIAINRIFRDVLSDDIMPSKQWMLLQNIDADADQSMTDADHPELDDIEHPESTGVVAPLSNEEMDPLYVTMDDFLQAVPLVQPSSKREGFATVPDVSWHDIGALTSVREELTLSVLEPIRNPEKFATLGLSLPAGVLLYGPPGCGKTLLAKAIANESGCNFLSVKGPELLDKYVGESERAVRVVFERARSSSPCVVFFDEVDSLCPKRGSDGGGGGGVSERVVNQLLTEMDGLESRRSVFVIAATNRPELIDPAMMRPGRLDKLLYVPLPTPDDRSSILRALAGKIRLADDVDLNEIGHSSRADGYSGADCAALLREAGLAVLKQSMVAPDTELRISRKHFDYAFDHVLPSVSKRDQAQYDKLRNRMARARSRAVTEHPAEVKSEESMAAAAAESS